MVYTAYQAASLAQQSKVDELEAKINGLVAVAIEGLAWADGKLDSKLLQNKIAQLRSAIQPQEKG